jgi:hypothetical protein
MMFNLQHYKPIGAISLTMLLTIAISPLVSVTSASAQLFPESERNRDYERDNRDYERDNRDYNRDSRVRSTTIIPSGTQIPLEYDKEKILLTKEETIPVTLTVAANIRDRDRNLLIPYGTEIEGQIEPDGDGSRFVAQELVFEDGTREYINGSSDTVTRTETVKRGKDTGDILTGAAIGGGAAAVLGEIFGDINIEEVLGGAALGALGGWLLGRESVELVSIDPNRDLDIILESDLALR